MKLDNIQPAKPVTPEVKEELPKAKLKGVELTKTAIGLYRIPQVGAQGTKYVLVEIDYDPVTGTVGEVKEVLRDNREDSIDKFKMKAADMFLEESN